MGRAAHASPRARDEASATVNAFDLLLLVWSYALVAAMLAAVVAAPFLRADEDG
jgi:hypothetical protein